jgi:hypothetical protein
MLIQIQSIENIIIKSIIPVVAVFHICVIVIVSIIRIITSVLFLNIHFIAVIAANTIFSFSVIFDWLSKIIIIEWSILTIEIIGFYLIGLCNHFSLRISARGNHLRRLLWISIHICFICFIVIIINKLFIVWIIAEIVAIIAILRDKTLIILVYFNWSSKYHTLRLT